MGLRAASLLARFFLVLLAALAAGLWSAAPASAHLHLVETSPAAGGQVDKPLTEIRLTFSEPGTPVGTGFALRDGSGVAIPVSREHRDGGQTWLVHPATALGDGQYRLTWRVISPDTHVKSGFIDFSIRTAPAEPTTDPTATASAVATVHATATASPAASAVAGAERDGQEPPTPPVSDAERITQFVGVFGRWLCYGAVLLGVGGLFFALTTLVGTRGDIRVAQTWVRGTGWVVAVGATVEALALAATFTDDGSLASVTRSPALATLADTPAALAVAFRIVGAAGLLYAGVFKPLLISGPVVSEPDRQASPTALTSVPQQLALSAVAHHAPSGYAAARTTASDEPPPVLDPLDAPGVRLCARAGRPVLLFITTILLLASFVFDGHSIVAGPRVVTAFADFAHTTAVAVWAGGVLLLAVLLVTRARRGEPTGVAEMAVRFAVPASGAVVLAAVAGVVLTIFTIDRTADLWTTDWGRVLLTKIGLVVVVVFVGVYNNRKVVPALDGRVPATMVSLRRVVIVEALLMLGVILATAFLVTSET